MGEEERWGEGGRDGSASILPLTFILPAASRRKQLRFSFNPLDWRVVCSADVWKKGGGGGGGAAALIQSEAFL